MADPQPSNGSALIVVLVGTDHHRFDRLVDWSLRLAAESDARWFVQHGTSSWPATVPPQVEGRELLSADELGALVHEASCVVTHAGPGLIMDAQLAGHTPVVVPRDPALGEHVDDHQLRFTAHLAGSGRIRAARDLEAMRYQVGQALEARPGLTALAGMSNGEVVARFAALVDATVLRRQKSLRR